MCGIFGFVAMPNSSFDEKRTRLFVRQLFRLSETRGREAAGLAIVQDDRIHCHRASTSASRMLRSQAYQQFERRALGDGAKADSPGSLYPLAMIGHARLVTNGLQSIDANNQPVVSGKVVVVHNGIVVNDDDLWRQNAGLNRKAEVDTEIIAALIDHWRERGYATADALRLTIQSVQGEISIAVVFSDENALALYSNTGSLFLVSASDNSALFFVSEAHIAHLAKSNGVWPYGRDARTIQIRPQEARLIDLDTLESNVVSMSNTGGSDTSDGMAEGANGIARPAFARRLEQSRRIELAFERDEAARAALRRCSRCILPATMPYIEFDQDGVCNYCRAHQPNQPKGRESLEQALAAHRSGDGSADCLVAFSGGRDSSYGLHVLKTQLGMNPIAYTYDWGMVTDLARRNQARICGRLGIEHLWVSADIKAKRANIRSNVNAWMRRPHLGMVPIFMAGDKQFFYHANKKMSETGVKLMVFCMNDFERTDFKAGFAGIAPRRHSGERTFTLDFGNKLRIASFYGGQFILNPAYINRSLMDTLFAFASYYLIDRDYLYLFDYLDWDETDINELLFQKYDWESAGDTRSTWRIGDGTAPFYNYIYYTVAGFTEYDTFRSNQIRESVISREQGLSLVEEENRPRWSSIREYVQTIGVDFDSSIQVINSIPKLYSL